MTNQATSEHVYCTYFDHHYLSRGIAMIESLQSVGDTGRIWVLCLSDQAYDIVAGLALPEVTPISIGQFEELHPELAAVRPERSLAEYFFTLTPWLVRYVMSVELGATWVTYLDADLWFFQSPQVMYDELAASSVGIVPHRYPPGQLWRLKFGTYNVGWVSFRLDDAGRACVKWWAARCLEWCQDTPDNGRFADQGYLDNFSDIVAGVHVSHHPGADLAPWNLRGHSVTWGNRSEVSVDGVPLVFFHFHGLARGARRFYFNHATYRVRTTPVIRDGIYLPYLTALTSVERRIRFSDVTTGLQASRRSRLSRLGAGRDAALRVLARLRGDSVRIPHQTPAERP